MRAGSYPAILGSTPNVSRWSVANPALRDLRLCNVRTNRPPPTSNIRLSPTWSATEIRRKRSGLLRAVIPCCFRAGARSGRQNCAAGAKLKRRLVNSANAQLKSMIRRSGLAEKGRSPVPPLQIMLISRAETRGASSMPNNPPAAPRSSPSTSNCCRTRWRFAPSA